MGDDIIKKDRFISIYISCMLVFLLLQSTNIYVQAITLNALAESKPSNAISVEVGDSYTKSVTSGEELWFKVDPSEIINTKTHIKFEVKGISYYISIYNNINNANDGKTHSDYLNKTSNISYPIAWIGPYYVKIKAASSGDMTFSMAPEIIDPKIAYKARPEINANVSSDIYAYSLSSDIQYNSQWNLQNIKQEVPTRTAIGVVNVVGKKYSDIDYTNLYSLKNNIVLPKTLIAVIDTGVNYELADLKDVVLESDGYDFVNNDNDAMDDNNHGTHIAGIIAAKGDNGYSISGINRFANILPIKVLNSNGLGTESNVAKGIRYAVDMGAKVINLSLGVRKKDGSKMFPEDAPQIETQIKYAYDKGVTVIVAAGNDAKGDLSYPANSDYVINVGAIDNNDELASFSNWGTGLDIVAPGVSIPSLLSNGEVAYFSGTSMSAPHVSAVAGLLYSINSNLTTIDVKDILHSTSTDLGEKGYNTKFGYGRLSAAMAARMAEESNPKVQRLSGINRIETSIAIAKDQYSDKAPDAIVLATANNFADALAGSGLAYNYNAPLLLVNKTVNNSKNVLNYIKENLTENKSIYVLGGASAVSSEISDYLTLIGYKIIRLGGTNRYDTNQKIVDNLNILKGTSIVITTGGDFADALSISSIADIKGYPILLNSKENLLDNVSEYITKIQPKTVYIIGGTGVLSDNTYKQIKNLNPTMLVERLGGKDRYETSINIIEHFNLATNSITVATGKNFPDALSGSVLAAGKNCGVLLVDNKDVTKQIDLLSKQNITNIIVFGGEGIISDDIANALVQK